MSSASCAAAKTTKSARFRAEPANPPSEVLVPVILVITSLALNIAASAILRNQDMSFGLFVGIRMAVVAASTVITIGALFVAAALLDLTYGFFHTAVLKVAAITLTQSWVGDLAERIPIPFAGLLLAFLTTYAMFKYFFDLDDLEAIASMFIVRLVHWLVVGVALIAVLGAVLGGANVEAPFPGGAGNGVAPGDVFDPDDPEGDLPSADEMEL